MHPSNCRCVKCLVDRSSFGTEEAQAARSSVSDEQVARVMARVRELDAQTSDPREALLAVLFPPAEIEPTAEWKADLADVILREWLPGALADERVVEAAWDGIDAQHDKVGHVHASECCWSIPGAAEAALTAAVTALTEDDA